MAFMNGSFAPFHRVADPRSTYPQSLRHLIFRCHTSQPERLSRNHVHQEFRTRDAKDSFYFDAFPAAIDQARFRFGVIRLESQQPVYHALLETAGVLHLDGAECIAAIENEVDLVAGLGAPIVQSSVGTPVKIA